MSDNEITLEQAAKLALEEGAIVVDVDLLAEMGMKPFELPGAEATATLEAMLAAGRRGKVVK